MKSGDDRRGQDPGEEVIQLNHPGLETSATSIPASSTRRHWLRIRLHPGFDAIEVFNGKRVVEAEEVLRDWFNLLNADTLYRHRKLDSHNLVWKGRIRGTFSSAGRSFTGNRK
jgi:hypothetical protein